MAKLDFKTHRLSYTQKKTNKLTWHGDTVIFLSFLESLFAISSTNSSAPAISALFGVAAGTFGIPPDFKQPNVGVFMEFKDDLIADLMGISCNY